MARTRGRPAAAVTDTEALFGGYPGVVPTFPADEPFAPRITDGPLTRRASGLVLASGFDGKRVHGLTAAAVNIPFGEGPDSPKLKRENALQRKRPLQWQKDAWKNYDDVSEVRTGGRWMGDAQSRIRLFPALLSEDPDQPPIAASEAEGVSPADLRLAYDCLDRLQSDEGDRNEIQRVLGLNLFMVGEAWLVGTDEQPEFSSRSNPSGERWRAFSVEELRVTDRGQWAVTPHQGARDEECELLDPETTRIIRIYRRHGRWRLWPDGAMRAANLIADELLLQSQAIMGSLLSRLPAGIMPIPDDIALTADIDRDDDGEGEGNGDGEPGVLDMLIKHMSAPRSDPRSAAGQVPFLMRLPSELIKAMPADGIWKIARDIDPQQAPRIDQLIHRLAIAFDMPPELLIGKGDINHWNAWEIDEDGVRLHVEPYTALYAQALTASYLRPRMELGGVTDPERWVLWWDPTDVMSHPDQKANAVKGYEASPPLVSGHVTRRALGYGDDDAPDDDEMATIMEWRTKAAAAAAPFGESKAPPPGETHVAASSLPVIASGAPRGRRIGPPLVKIEERLHRDLLGAADAAVGRTIEKAQARIRSLAQKDKLARDLVGGIENDALVGVLGIEGVHALGFDDDTLRDGFAGVAAAAAGFTAEARQKAVAALRGAGLDVSDEQVAAWDRSGAANSDEGSAALIAGLAAVAAAVLYEISGGPGSEPPLGEFDPAFRVTPGLMREVLTIMGGGPSPSSDRGAGFLAAHDFDQLLGKFTREGDLVGGGFAWAVGAPLRPFDPHQELDGYLFTDWSDEGLAWDPGEFPYVSVLSPGDHEGCECTVVPDGEVMTANAVDDGEPPEGV